MSDKMNHFICPTCGHDFYDRCAYATCDACNTFFYASQSRTCQRTNTVMNPTINVTVKDLGWKP
jgi:hypothetical protein